MPFELSLTTPLPAALRQVADERIAESLAALTDHLADDSVHTARKRLKELRSVLRLLRGPLPRATFRRENTTYRDAARPLSDLRDAAVLIETLANLLAHYDEEPKAYAPLAGALERRHRAALKAARDRGAVRHLRTTLTTARERIPHLPLPADADDFSPLVPGLRRTYRDGRRAMEVALDDPSDDHLHEWRKRSKDLRYHLELLTPLNAPRVKALADDATDLTDMLGQDHDLAVLHALLTTTYHNTLPPDAHAAVESILLKRRRALQRKAKKLGRSLYDDKPKAFARRIKSYWKAAH